jgi:hypothetical protein
MWIRSQHVLVLQEPGGAVRSLLAYQTTTVILEAAPASGLQGTEEEGTINTLVQSSNSLWSIDNSHFKVNTNVH